jgi:P-type conjugative transfer protein TrbJ
MNLSISQLRRQFIATLVILLVATPAFAQFPGGAQIVFDPQMYARQLLELKQETMIVESLITGDMGGIYADPSGLLGDLGDIISQNEGLSYSSDTVVQDFEDLYPGTTIDPSAQLPWVTVQETLNTLQGVLASANAQHQNFNDEDTTLQRLDDQNAAAGGSLEAQQVANDIALHQARELQLSRQAQLAANNAQAAAEAAWMQSEIATENQAVVVGNETGPGALSDPASYGDSPPIPGMP